VAGIPMPALVIQLSISADKMMGYYRGQVKNVVARATTGQTVQFPASALQKYILQDGVHGRFRLQFDDNFKFLGLEPVAAG
jgi:hypothetical protein